MRLDSSRALTEADEALTVTVFNEDGGRTPWLFIRTWHGELPAYQRLSRAVGADQPIYTVAPPTGVTKEDYPGTVDDWARWVCAQIAELSGDVLIGGFSFGGLIGLHVTREIGRQDIQFPHVLLIDTSLPRKTHLTSRSRSHRMVKALERILALEPGEQRREHLRAKMDKRKAKRAKRRQDAAGAPAAPEDIMTSTGMRMPLLKRAIWVSYLKYQPRTWNQSVFLFWTEESRGKARDDIALGWTRWMRGPMVVERLEGEHLTIMSEKHVDSFAAKLSGLPSVTSALPRSLTAAS